MILFLSGFGSFNFIQDLCFSGLEIIPAPFSLKRQRIRDISFQQNRKGKARQCFFIFIIALKITACYFTFTVTSTLTSDMLWQGVFFFRRSSNPGDSWDRRAESRRSVQQRRDRRQRLQRAGRRAGVRDGKERI